MISPQCQREIMEVGEIEFACGEQTPWGKALPARGWFIRLWRAASERDVK